MAINFSSALNVAAVAVRDIVIETGLDLRLVRDERGRIIFQFNCRQIDVPFNTMERLRADCAKLETYSPADGIRTYSEIPERDIFFVEGWSEVWIESEEHGAFMVPVKDLAAWGRDWFWLDKNRDRSVAKRVVFHGLKGGVGRSTALAVYAQAQAKAGRRVLVLDLDIESPGASSAMLDSKSLPISGVIDWITENLVRSSGVRIEDCYSESSLSANEAGAIFVVPAIGSDDRDFVSKLGRAYVDDNGRTFSDRVETMLSELEEHLAPDLVLIDSRAGIHEVAAFAITRLSDISLLFFADTEQNWVGYRQLFEFWRTRPEVLRQVREKVIAIRALAADSSDFQEFVEKSHSLFSESLYDEVLPGSDNLNIFAFDLRDESAPHYPPIIHLHPRFHERNLLRPIERGGISQEEVRLAFGQFIDRVNEALGLE